MEDMQEKISNLLNDPEGMEKIKNMANALFGDNAIDEKPKQVHNNIKTPSFLQGLATPSDAGNDMFKDIDIGAIMRVMSAVKNTKNDSRTSLLLALKPHLSPDRSQRVDSAVKILKIISILPILKEQGIFNNLF